MSGVALAVWSGPRNISTALMRSFETRSDTEVVDEPLYAYYLAASGADHPARDEVIAAGEVSWEKVVADLTAPREGVYYQKHMAHHLLPELPREWIGSLANVLLIRDPLEVLASYVRKRAGTPRTEDLGFRQQVELYEQLGPETPVVDAADFLRDPRSYLCFLCEYAGVPFEETMLEWEPGPRRSDGVWAAHWYDVVLSSTGFQPYRRQEVELDGAAGAVATECRPFYERLHAARVVLPPGPRSKEEVERPVS